MPGRARLPPSGTEGAFAQSVLHLLELTLCSEEIMSDCKAGGLSTVGKHPGWGQEQLGDPQRSLGPNVRETLPSVHYD